MKKFAALLLLSALALPLLAQPANQPGASSPALDGAVTAIQATNKNLSRWFVIVVVALVLYALVSAWRIWGYSRKLSQLHELRTSTDKRFSELTDEFLRGKRKQSELDDHLTRIEDDVAGLRPEAAADARADIARLDSTLAMLSGRIEQVEASIQAVMDHKAEPVQAVVPPEVAELAGTVETARQAVENAMLRVEAATAQAQSAADKAAAVGQETEGRFEKLEARLQDAEGRLQSAEAKAEAGRSDEVRLQNAESKVQIGGEKAETDGRGEVRIEKPETRGQNAAGKGQIGEEKTDEPEKPADLFAATLGVATGPVEEATEESQGRQKREGRTARTTEVVAEAESPVEEVKEPKRAPVDELKEGDAHFAAGEFGDAIDSYTRVLGTQSQFTDEEELGYVPRNRLFLVLHNRAVANLRLGRYMDALNDAAALEPLSDVEPKAGGAARILSGVVHLNQGLIDEALDDFAQALIVDPGARKVMAGDEDIEAWLAANPRDAGRVRKALSGAKEKPKTVPPPKPAQKPGKGAVETRNQKPDVRMQKGGANRGRSQRPEARSQNAARRRGRGR